MSSATVLMIEPAIHELRNMARSWKVGESAAERVLAVRALIPPGAQAGDVVFHGIGHVDGLRALGLRQRPAG
jgi:hypothetical protein